MKFGRIIAFVTAALMFAGIIAGTGAVSVLAAESTTQEDALKIALDDAGLSKDDVTIDDIEKGQEQGASVYEIEFWTDSKEYEYDIALADGEIVSREWELTDYSASGKQIKKGVAQRIALDHAGVKSENAMFKKAVGGIKDGCPVYEFKFEDSAAEYEYVIAKEGGEILKCSEKIKTPACVKAAKKAAVGAQEK